MRRLTWMMALSMAVIMPSLGPGAAEATPDRSGLLLTLRLALRNAHVR